jgi:hypothetical protein
MAGQSWPSRRIAGGSEADPRFQDRPKPCIASRRTLPNCQAGRNRQDPSFVVAQHVYQVPKAFAVCCYCYGWARSDGCPDHCQASPFLLLSVFHLTISSFGPLLYASLGFSAANSLYVLSGHYSGTYLTVRQSYCWRLDHHGLCH